MKTKRLGQTGLKVSEICLGTMTFGNQCDETSSFAILDRAWDSGVFFLDTADVYPLGATPEMRGRSETIVGQWMKERRRRDRVVLATSSFRKLRFCPVSGGLQTRWSDG